MHIQPYLFFDGRCDEAIAFYQKSLGAKVGMLMRFKDCPDKGGIRPGTEEKVMHASITIGDTEIMASDGECSGTTKFGGFGLALSMASEAEADKSFNALTDGGQTIMPMGKTFFSPRFGMVADKFGITWMIMVTPKA